MDTLRQKLDSLEHAIAEANARVGDIGKENRLLKQKIEQLQHQLADTAHHLALLQQTEDKFPELQRETLRLRDEREKLRSEVEHLIRKVTSLRAALFQPD